MRCATPADVIVVGAGGAGVAAADALARRGQSVVVFDRFPAGHERGSSHGTERIFRYVYTDPLYVALALDARARWAELEARSGTELLRTTGGIDFGGAAHLDALARALDAHGIEYERLDPSAARARVDALSVDSGALFQPGGAVIHADRVLEAFRRVATQAGAEFVDDDAVVGLRDEQDHVVATSKSGRVIRGRVAVVAAGAWSAHLLGSLTPNLPSITVTQEQVAFFRPHRDIDRLPTFIVDGDPPIYGLATPTGLLKIAEHGSGRVVEPDTRSFAVEPERWRALCDWVAAHVPGVDPEPVDARTCLYASTSDESFVLERVGSIVVGAGLGGHGFKFLPSIGERLADLAS